jgi:glycosyltransferase involved in cell wall biosynthesis
VEFLPTFSVIIPTTGRTTLKRTLRRLQREDRADIEVIVVSDGAQPVSERIVARAAVRWPAIRYVTGTHTSKWGNSQRMQGMQHATGQYLLFIDDDDVHSRGSFTHIRRATRLHPHRIIIFRMRRFDTTLWATPIVALGQIGTPQFLVPNRPNRLGTWMTHERRESDFDFLTETIALQGDPVWDPHIIAIVAPLEWRHFGRWVMPRLRHVRAKAGMRTRLRRFAEWRHRARL